MDKNLKSRFGKGRKKVEQRNERKEKVTFPAAKRKGDVVVICGAWLLLSAELGRDVRSCSIFLKSSRFFLYICFI